MLLISPESRVCLDVMLIFSGSRMLPAMLVLMYFRGYVKSGLYIKDGLVKSADTAITGEIVICSRSFEHTR